MSSNDLDQPGMSDENAKLFAKYDFWQLYHRMAASHGWEFRPYVVALPNRYKTRHCTPQQYHSYCLKFNNAIRTKLRRTLDHLIHLPGFCQRKPAFIKKWSGPFGSFCLQSYCQKNLQPIRFCSLLKSLWVRAPRGPNSLKKTLFKTLRVIKKF